MARAARLWAFLVLAAAAGCIDLPSVPDVPRELPSGDPGLPPDVPIPDADAVDARDPGPRDADAAVDPGRDEGAPDTGCLVQCYGKSCGDDGCGGTCGTCPSGTRCSFDGALCIPLAVQAPLGGACGPRESCGPVVTDPWALFGGRANPDYPGCLDDQCREGPCEGGACSRGCTPRLDVEQNGTGIPVADGIEDPGAPPGDCEGALPDRFPGRAWACVETRLPGDPEGAGGRCLPRSSFTPCHDGTACPAGEACGFLVVRGNLESRCLAVPAGAGAPGAACGWDPRLGEGLACASWACSADGCTAPCADDGDCGTPGARCDAGTGTCQGSGAPCATDADCSAWGCTTGVALEQPPGSFVACAPRPCAVDADCRDPGYYCLHDPQALVAALEDDPPGRCARRVEGGAGPGGACDAHAGDGMPDRPCADAAYCLDGRCGSLCRADGDCAGDQRCALRDTPADLTGDGVADQALPVPLCVTTGPGAAPCQAAADCPSGACVPWVPAAAPEDPGLLCMEPLPGALPAGAPCGEAAFGAACRSRACLWEDAENGVPGTCTEPCRTQEDCPALSPSGSGTVRWTCEARPLSARGTRLLSDDLWASWCTPVPGDSSLLPCDGTTPCADPREYCRPTVRAGIPGGQEQVRPVCVRAGEGEAPGMPCDPSRGGRDCMTGLCERTAFPGVGVCTTACATDADCARMAGWGAACLPRVVVPREDPARSLSVLLCRPAGTCVACASDLDCTGDLACMNVSPVPYLRDLRCARPCAVDADCAGDPPGTACVETGAPVESTPSGRRLACLPLACP